MKFLFLLLALVFAPSAHAEDEADVATARLIEKKTDFGTLSYPILMNLDNFTAQEEINVETLAYIAEWRCDERNDKTHFNARSKVRLFNDVAFSYTTDMDYNCGGPYPDRQIKTNNYYLHTGKQIFLEEVFPVSMPVAERNAFIMKDHSIENDQCTDAYGDPELHWDFYMTREAVIFRPRFPHALQACVQDFPVATERIKDYFLPGALTGKALHQDEYKE